MKSDNAMAEAWNLEDEQRARDAMKADEWYQSRPKIIQEALDLRPPFFLYEMSLKCGNYHNVVIYSFSEPGEEQHKCDFEDTKAIIMNTHVMATVVVLQKYNPHKILAFERRVFGIRLDELEPIRLLGGETE